MISLAEFRKSERLTAQKMEKMRKAIKQLQNTKFGKGFEYNQTSAGLNVSLKKKPIRRRGISFVSCDRPVQIKQAFPATAFGQVDSSLIYTDQTGAAEIRLLMPFVDGIEPINEGVEVELFFQFLDFVDSPGKVAVGTYDVFLDLQVAFILEPFPLASTTWNNKKPTGVFESLFSLQTSLLNNTNGINTTVFASANDWFMSKRHKMSTGSNKVYGLEMKMIGTVSFGTPDTWDVSMLVSEADTGERYQYIKR